VSKENNYSYTQTSTSNQIESPSSITDESGNRLVGVKVDSTTARVISPSNPQKVHATVKVFHPSMLLAD